jgi:hypothetical protein
MVQTDSVGTKDPLSGQELVVPNPIVSDLAVNGQVAASTQNQAFNALLLEG